MGSLWSKVWHDLWHDKTRTVLAIFSVTIGVYSLGVIFGMISLMLSEMDQAHQAVKPSHINMILRQPVRQDVIDELKGINGVENIDPVNQITIRFRSREDEKWTIGTLVMRQNYDKQIYDQIILKEGNFPENQKLGVERFTSQKWGIDIGEEIYFRVAGLDRIYEIRGIIRHPFVQPPNFGGQAHFFTDANGLAEFGIPAGYFNQLLVRVKSYRVEETKRVAAEIRDRLADHGYGVVVTLYQDPEKHWGRQFVEGVYIVLGLMAVVSLFLSVILVLNTFTALITQQTDQIGVIKALGGGRHILLKTYLTSALFYGITSLILAIPLSSFTAWFISKWFLNLFNIDFSLFRIAIPAIILQIIAGIFAPIMAAFLPVWNGARMSVRQAIATYGIGADFGISRFDRWIEALCSRFLATPYAIAIGNLFRRKGRLTLTLLVMIVAGITFLIVMSLISSTRKTIDNEMLRRKYDFRIGFFQEQDNDKVLDIVHSLNEISGSEVWYSRNVTLYRDDERIEDSTGLGAQLIGVPVDTNMLSPLIVEGRWLDPDDDNSILISKDTALKNNLKIGEKVRLNLGDLGRSDWKIVGIYGVVLGGGFVVEAVYAPLAAVTQATGQPGKSSQVYVQVNEFEKEKVVPISDRLQEEFEKAGIRVDFYTSSVKEEERTFAYNQFDPVIQVLLILSILMAFVGGIGLMGALGISVMERRREIGVMRSIGAQSRTIIGQLILEALFQGLLSWILAVPIAFFVAQPFSRLLGQKMLDINLDYSFNWLAILIWLAIILSIAVMMSIIPARSAVRLSVKDALAY